MENSLRARDDDPHVPVLLNPSVPKDAFEDDAARLLRARLGDFNTAFSEEEFSGVGVEKVPLSTAPEKTRETKILPYQGVLRGDQPW